MSSFVTTARGTWAPQPVTWAYAVVGAPETPVAHRTL
jgi:hypothetical protein